MVMIPSVILMLTPSAGLTPSLMVTPLPFWGVVTAAHTYIYVTVYFLPLYTGILAYVVVLFRIGKHHDRTDRYAKNVR